MTKIRSMRSAVTRARVLGAITCLAAALLLLAGCGGVMNYESGRPFNPGLVAAKLHPGTSTAADVTALLGTPYGTGSAMMPYHDRPRVTWTYFYDRGGINISSGRIDDELAYLFVFFQGDKFDSYIWFDTVQN